MAVSPVSLNQCLAGSGYSKTIQWLSTACNLVPFTVPPGLVHQPPPADPPVSRLAPSFPTLQNYLFTIHIWSSHSLSENPLMMSLGPSDKVQSPSHDLQGVCSLALTAWPARLLPPAILDCFEFSAGAGLSLQVVCICFFLPGLLFLPLPFPVCLRVIF